MKIYVFDSWRWHWTETIEALRKLGHEVRTGIYWGPELVEWADVAIFHPVDNNLKQASLKQEKPKDTFVLAEAVDIDIYSGHPGGINWDYVDALVFMSEHMREYAEGRFKFPETLPIGILPGGIDLDRWTLRRDQSRGHNIAWIGRFWIAKNVFGALQIFNQLIRTRPKEPWRLFLRGQKLDDPPWWGNHIRAYLGANPELDERIEFVPWVEDMNVWLEKMDFYLMTSFKEAFSYSSGQCAAKGIKVVMQMTNGMNEVWPKSWIFQTHDEAVRMFLGSYEPETYRSVVAERYPLSRRVERLNEICDIS